jgi:hypothetical protein
MPLSFPTNPTTGATYTYGNKAWVYDGVKWVPNQVSAAVATVSSSAPTPTVGRLWYDNSTGTNILKVWNGSAWAMTDAASFRATAPVNPVQGQMWYDTGYAMLRVWDSNTWTGIATNLQLLTYNMAF